MAERTARRERLITVRWKPEKLSVAVEPAHDVLAVLLTDGR
jgi:hypothetical protein